MWAYLTLTYAFGSSVVGICFAAIVVLLSISVQIWIYSKLWSAGGRSVHKFGLVAVCIFTSLLLLPIMPVIGNWLNVAAVGVLQLMSVIASRGNAAADDGIELRRRDRVWLLLPLITALVGVPFYWSYLPTIGG
jgi:hypothetical protein